MHVTLTQFKKSGLVEIAKQLDLSTSNLKKIEKNSLINIIDPKLRSLENHFYVVVGKKCFSTASNHENYEIKDQTKEQIKSFC